MHPAQPHFTKAKSRLPEEKEEAHSLIIKRIKFIPLLIFGLLGYGILFHILTAIEPSQIANVLFYESYLPLHIVFLVGNFFLLSFALLHTRRALVWSIFLAILLFFKLQSVAFTFDTLASTVAIFLLIESIFTFIFKK